MPDAMTLDSGTTLLMILRWFHFIFGITWIGLLYFFNFVNVPFGKTMDADTKKKVVPQLMPRALWWFRWGAMITFLTGWSYIFAKLHLNSRPMSDLLTTTWGNWIGLGALMGSVMWFNVWFIIWPSQKRIITSVKTGQAPPDLAAITRRAFLASRLNTYLSVPLLFCMGGASHFPSFNWLTFLIMAVFSVVLTWHLIEKVSPKAGSNF